MLPYNSYKAWKIIVKDVRVIDKSDPQREGQICIIFLSIYLAVSVESISRTPKVCEDVDIFSKLSGFLMKPEDR